MSGLLSLLIFTPLVGAIVLLFVPKEKSAVLQWATTFFSGVTFVLSLPLWFHQGFRQNGDFYFREDIDWIPSLGARYSLGVDGIAALLILLTTLLTFISVYCSFTAIQKREKEYYIFLLLLEVGMIGVFCALDFFLFYVFWEVMLVPMYFLIGVWGGPRKLYAAIKFFLYTLFGSVIMLLGIIALYFVNTTGFLWWQGLGNSPTFDILHYHQIASQLPADLQIWLFWAFFLGFAIKVPMFPFHTWLPDAHVEAPTAGSVILAGVLLKMGTYGFVRFSMPMFPDGIQSSATFLGLTTIGWVVLLSIVGIIYGSMVAMVQPDMKKLVAYSSVAHLGFVMLGLFALNNAGVQGGILQMINHGLSTGGLFLLVGIVYERRHTRMIADYGGLSHQMPIYATLFMIILLASIGLPLLNGFIGEFTILVGAFIVNWRWAAWAALGIVLGAAYMLWLYQRVFFGEIKHEENRELQDVNLREILTLAPLIVLCFWIGLYPKPFFEMTAKSTEKIVAANVAAKARAEAPRMATAAVRTTAAVATTAAPKAAPAGAVAATEAPRGN
ncbi:MAG: NADH-quinone oxidoreductase subunit M [Thermoanaerobaculia bacterium]|nr:NADH-quinone oxidoreductase subunit M [Thermoanaerobaculia bacterium]